MYCNKHPALILIGIISYISSFGQPGTGFSTNVRVDKPNNGGGRFITDYAGGRTTQAYLFRDIDLSVYELAAANFSFTDKDQVQKINFQPFRLLTDSTKFLDFAKLNEAQKKNIITFLNSVKLNVAQKKDITTFGIGFGADNSDPFSKRGNRILDTVFNSQPAAPLPIIPDTSKYAQIRDDIKTSNHSTDIKKIMLVTMVDIPIEKLVEKARQANEKQNAEFKETTLDSLLLAYDERRAHHVFKWTIGFNTQFFSILSAKGTANNFDSLNHYSNKANIYSVTASYSYDRGWASVSTSYNYIESRKNAVKESNKINYNGYGFSLTKRICTFLSPEKLKLNENYKKSLFIPSLVLGGSWELKATPENNFILIEESIKRSRVLTLFVDILISPIAQFRIGLPIQKNTLISGEKMSLIGANVQYALKFSSLN